MRFSTSQLLALTTLVNLSHAFPLSFLQNLSPRAPNPAPTYSVVPVDGGSSTVAPTQTKTQTIISTFTPDATQWSSIQVTTVPVTVTNEATRTMVVEPSVTSVPYDDGQWKTTYYYRSTVSNAYVPVSSAVEAQSESETTTQWNDWSGATVTASSVETVTPSSSSSAAKSSITDWSTVYGTWRDAPVDGKWWGRDEKQ